MMRIRLIVAFVVGRTPTDKATVVPRSGSARSVLADASYGVDAGAPVPRIRPAIRTGGRNPGWYSCSVATRTRRLHKYTYEAYLEHEASSNVKHEFLEGEIYAMAGGTVEHAVLAVNVSTALRSQLRGKP